MCVRGMSGAPADMCEHGAADVRLLNVRCTSMRACYILSVFNDLLPLCLCPAGI